MKKRVLFLCTGNSCRSQMAEGILRKLAGGVYEVFSAGMKPSVVNLQAIKAMSEIEIDISGHRSKSVDEFKRQVFNFVITVCDRAKDSCPIFPNALESRADLKAASVIGAAQAPMASDTQKIHWSFEDPAEAEGSEEERMKVFRRVRGEISRRLQLFVTANREKVSS